jgi:hypothetical protein
VERQAKGAGFKISDLGDAVTKLAASPGCKPSKKNERHSQELIFFIVE